MISRIWLSRMLALFVAAALALTAAAAQAQVRRVVIGYSSLSSNQTPLWVAKEEGIFKKFGLEPELILIKGGTRGAQALISGDVPAMGMSGQPVISARARVASLQTGGSDAVIVNPGLALTLKERGFNVLADFTELPIPYPQQVFAVRERLIKSDPDLLERFLKAVAAGTVFTWEPRNKEKDKAVLAKYLRLDKIDRAEEHYQSALKVLPKKPYVDPVGISSMIEFMAETDPLVAKVEPENVINHTLLKKLDDSGFLDQLYKK